MFEKNIKLLSEYFKDKKIVLAFSGGLDSTVLLEIASETSSSVLPIIVKSSLVPDEELESALEYLEEKGLEYRVLHVNPLNHPQVVENDIRRCYYCKKSIFETIIEDSRSYNPDLIVEGSNVSDLSDYRPGMDALKELGIASPYLQLKIDKNQIKSIAERLDLKVAKKPSASCLATRIPYGQKLDELRLQRIETAEKMIKSYLPISVLRVRDHGDVARIEISQSDFFHFNKIKHRKIMLGYNHISIDLEGYKLGSMNIGIESEKNE
jgi:uncharacterized protein